MNETRKLNKMINFNLGMVDTAIYLRKVVLIADKKYYSIDERIK